MENIKGDNELKWFVRIFQWIISERKNTRHVKNKLFSVNSLKIKVTQRNVEIMMYSNKISGEILREETIVPTNQFGIMPGKSTMKPIFCMR